MQKGGQGLEKHLGTREVPISHQAVSGGHYPPVRFGIAHPDWAWEPVGAWRASRQVGRAACTLNCPLRIALIANGLFT